MCRYGVALLSRLLTIIGLFCKRALQKKRYIFLLCVIYESTEYVKISRLLQIIRLFCKRALSKRLYFAKETYNIKGPTNRAQLRHVTQKTRQVNDTTSFTSLSGGLLRTCSLSVQWEETITQKDTTSFTSLSGGLWRTCSLSVQWEETITQKDTTSFTSLSGGDRQRTCSE